PPLPERGRGPGEPDQRAPGHLDLGPPEAGPAGAFRGRGTRNSHLRLPLPRTGPRRAVTEVGQGREARPRSCQFKCALGGNGASRIRVEYRGSPTPLPDTTPSAPAAGPGTPAPTPH